MRACSRRTKIAFEAHNSRSPDSQPNSCWIANICFFIFLCVSKIKRKNAFNVKIVFVKFRVQRNHRRLHFVRKRSSNVHTETIYTINFFLFSRIFVRLVSKIHLTAPISSCVSSSRCAVSLIFALMNLVVFCCFLLSSL